MRVFCQSGFRKHEVYFKKEQFYLMHIYYSLQIYSFFFPSVWTEVTDIFEYAEKPYVVSNLK